MHTRTLNAHAKACTYLVSLFELTREQLLLISHKFQGVNKQAIPSGIQKLELQFMVVVRLNCYVVIRAEL